MAEPPVKTSAEAKLDDIQAKLQEALRISQAAEEAAGGGGAPANPSLKPAAPPGVGTTAWWLEQHGVPRRFDLLSVDIEGLDAAVLEFCVRRDRQVLAEESKQPRVRDGLVTLTRQEAEGCVPHEGDDRRRERLDAAFVITDVRCDHHVQTVRGGGESPESIAPSQRRHVERAPDAMPAIPRTVPPQQVEAFGQIRQHHGRRSERRARETRDAGARAELQHSPPENGRAQLVVLGQCRRQEVAAAPDRTPCAQRIRSPIHRTRSPLLQFERRHRLLQITEMPVAEPLAERPLCQWLRRR